MLLQFSDAFDRSAFLERLRAEAPDAWPSVKPSYSQSTVVIVRGADAAQEGKIRAIAETFRGMKEPSDVQFKVFGAAE